MNENRCKDCRFWEALSLLNNEFGNCNSLDANDATYSPHRPKAHFGCPYWQEKEREPGLREELAEYIESLLVYHDIGSDEDIRKVYGIHEADKIIAIFERCGR